jgi:hypothetical protein
MCIKYGLREEHRLRVFVRIIFVSNSKLQEITGGWRESKKKTKKNA